MIVDSQVADLSIIKYGLLSNEGMTGYILKIKTLQVRPIQHETCA